MTEENQKKSKNKIRFGQFAMAGGSLFLYSSITSNMDIEPITSSGMSKSTMFSAGGVVCWILAGCFLVASLLEKK